MLVTTICLWKRYSPSLHAHVLIIIIDFVVARFVWCHCRLFWKRNVSIDCFILQNVESFGEKRVGVRLDFGVRLEDFQVPFELCFPVY